MTQLLSKSDKENKTVQTFFLQTEGIILAKTMHFNTWIDYQCLVAWISILYEAYFVGMYLFWSRYKVRHSAQKCAAVRRIILAKTSWLMHDDEINELCSVKTLYCWHSRTTRSFIKDGACLGTRVYVLRRRQMPSNCRKLPIKLPHNSPVISNAYRCVHVRIGQKNYA